MNNYLVVAIIVILVLSITSIIIIHRLLKKIALLNKKCDSLNITVELHKMLQENNERIIKNYDELYIIMQQRVVELENRELNIDTPDNTVV